MRMPNPVRFLLPIALCVMLCAQSARADDDSDSPAPMLERVGAPASVVDRSAIVEAEIKALGDHPWAGSYYLGDGLGMNVKLSLAPSAGVVATWMGCMG